MVVLTAFTLLTLQSVRVPVFAAESLLPLVQDAAVGQEGLSAAHQGSRKGVAVRAGQKEDRRH